MKEGRGSIVEKSRSAKSVRCEREKGERVGVRSKGWQSGCVYGEKEREDLNSKGYQGLTLRIRKESTTTKEHIQLKRVPRVDCIAPLLVCGPDTFFFCSPVLVLVLVVTATHTEPQSIK